MSFLPLKVYEESFSNVKSAEAADIFRIKITMVIRLHVRG